MKNKIIFIIIFILFMTMYMINANEKYNLELYAIKYGDSKFNSRYIFYNDKENKYYDFSWLLYLIKYKNKIILIDTGFADRILINEFRIKFYDPLSTLERLGIRPEDVTDVVLTHSHFDHIGNIDKFTDANIYIQKDELDSFSKYGKFANIKKFINENKKITTFSDSFLLYDFFRIIRIGGHTIGSSIVEFNYNSTEYILTGDECYLFDNINLNKPSGTFYNHTKNRNFINELNKKNNSGKYLILTFHDPSIVEGDSRFKRIIP